MDKMLLQGMPAQVMQQIERAEKLAEALSEQLDEDSIVASDILDELARLGLKLVEDPETNSSHAYMALACEGDENSLARVAESARELNR